jgi:hypothetical protein
MKMNPIYLNEKCMLMDKFIHFALKKVVLNLNMTIGRTN